MATVIKYWPSVVALLYLLYVLAAGQAAQVGPALAALLATFGVNASAAAAHSKLDALK
jgi:hypothetical protein